MANINNNAEQNIIAVHKDEIEFFDAFTKKYNICWSYEEKQAGILPLSKSYVGYINTPFRMITLKPKYNEIGFEHIVRMYLYVYGYRPTDSAAVLDVSEADTSADVADMFIKNLRKNVQEGIIRTYDRKRVNTKAIKGHVDYLKTYYNLLKMKRNYVDTRISILSVDNDYNALIMTALAKLRHIDKYSSISASLSMYFEGAKSNVTDGSKLLNNIVFNSNTSRYRKTLTYAAMIIDQLSYSDTGSVVGTDSFLINFDRLFEDFVIKILKEVPEKKEFSTWNSVKKFAEVSRIEGVYEIREYQPDIIYKFIPEDEKFEYMPSAYAVLDVKNKAHGLFKNADIYQMLTYTRLLHGQKSVLLYPSFYKRMPEKLLLNPSIFMPSEINACFINIADKSGEDFLESIRWFVDTVVKIISDIPISKVSAK